MELVTRVDVGDPRRTRVDAKCLLSIELDDGERVPLLTDRGWGSTALWTETSMEEMEADALTVVGPDAPFDDHTEEEMARGYWKTLEREARDRNLAITAEELAGLPHHVEFTEEVFTRVDGGDGA
ncbi:hypothetical protein [Ornithinimicrobium murale]|uniref:hypothetical protein n=1 Tax=Ornithinimicrobium murale TaxID=1050153 RepID=UPI000E0D1F2F|nr:hypothetical protein [Ornithinimicrobium murale]